MGAAGRKYELRGLIVWNIIIKRFVLKVGFSGLGGSKWRGS